MKIDRPCILVVSKKNFLKTINKKFDKLSLAWQGNHEVMQLLLYYGAIPDHACKQGATALGISSQEGHEECVLVLLQYGANPLKSDHCGRTPYKLASKSNRQGVIRILENFAKSMWKKLKLPCEHVN